MSSLVAIQIQIILFALVISKLEDSSKMIKDDHCHRKLFHTKTHSAKLHQMTKIPHKILIRIQKYQTATVQYLDKLHADITNITALFHTPFLVTTCKSLFSHVTFKYMIEWL